MSDRKLVETVEFGGAARPPSVGTGDAGQLVTPQFLAFIEHVLSGKLPEQEADEQDDPQVRALAEELSVIHLPAWRRGAGSEAPPTVTGIKQATRVAEYLVQRGVRVHPELQEIRWAPTPGGQPGAFDTGVHVHKDADGRWPDPEPDDFYDIDDIDVTQTDDGVWCAVHPRGLTCEAPTKTEAYAGLVEQLRARIEQARGAE